MLNCMAVLRYISELIAAYASLFAIYIRPIFIFIIYTRSLVSADTTAAVIAPPVVTTIGPDNVQVHLIESHIAILTTQPVSSDYYATREPQPKLEDLRQQLAGLHN